MNIEDLNPSHLLWFREKARRKKRIILALSRRSRFFASIDNFSITEKPLLKASSPVRVSEGYQKKLRNAPSLQLVDWVLMQILLSVCFGLASGVLRLCAAKTAAQSSGAVAGFPVSL
jgi:hypothetical protein